MAIGEDINKIAGWYPFFKSSEYINFEILWTKSAERKKHIARIALNIITSLMVGIYPITLEESGTSNKFNPIKGRLHNAKII